MKEKFSIVVETLHANDDGERENVSSWRRTLLIVVFFFLFLLLSFCARFFYVNQIKNTQKYSVIKKTLLLIYRRWLDLGETKKKPQLCLNPFGDGYLIFM